MTTRDAKVFEQYKPFRNAIRLLSTVDSLEVIHAYMLNLQLGIPIPPRYGAPWQFTSASPKHDRAKWIIEFHLETLCREIILHGMELGRSSKTLRDWNTLAKTINKLKHFESFLYDQFVSGDSDPLMQELHRMAHRQFPWLMSWPTAVNITRYF